MKKNRDFIQLGNKIREIREIRGMSQVVLAGKLNKSKETISNFERGKTIPSVATLVSLARVLDIQIKDFFDYTPAAKDDKNISFIEARMQMMSDDDRAVLAMIADGLCKIRKKKG
jgi:transcriptional regulator with XRE-family HTH domain